ncbi:hypothetical protein LSH36_1626g00006 [Paralvinella palmiformis]|uniref:Uncharacterized protein n=1 Tax=Paralvinella palmiformis TaxID=53620 RepID=A0AAD9ITG4_9ANNE|nr:hypothetical protein LSH36_1626g00006 [Paralvinella palmiformis]
MWVGEQSNDWDEPENEGNFSIYNLAVAELVNATRCIGAYTLQIPNQGLKFTNHPDPTDDIKEDTLIAWTWRTFLDMEDPPDPTLPMRMPMTKAAKRGLDTISEFADQYLGLSINQFMPFGASKVTKLQ